MNSDEIRTEFLGFFEEKGHEILPSSSLIPASDPTLLLTTAGMVQLKPYFLGELTPPNHRLVSCQKCFRTTDIEEVGDLTHLTFFEMLGNFSMDDYFKEETIEWAWEFVTDRLKLPIKRLWVTIYNDDTEAFHIWRKLDIPEDRIVRYGEEENFWGPAGDSGPCGPSSEIIYDFGEEFGCGKISCGPNCGCGRFSEIWNLVFSQYNQGKDGHRTLLPKLNIDTGMGLERTAAILQGKTSVYDTDLFTPLLKHIAALADKSYGSDEIISNCMRVIVEHSRGIVFLIGDGVIPLNEGRGYVLRRLLRRAALFGRRLGLDKPFLKELTHVVIEGMKHVYPELKQRQNFITKTIDLEESRFNETLNTGLQIVDNMIDSQKGTGGNEISGKEAFKLYDTYGFPIEITSEIARDRNFSVDLPGFEKEMGKQRKRAKAAQKFNGIPKAASFGESLNIKETPFVGYQHYEHKSTIINLLINGKTVETIPTRQEAGIIMETTPFYAEMGGQVGDNGEITNQAGRFSVTKTIQIPPGIIIHQGYVVKGSLSGGNEVIAKVDKERRLDISRNHTATHLLQYGLRQVLGEHIQQRGSLVEPDRLRFDFSHPSAITGGEIQTLNRLVNEKIRQNIEIYDEEIPYKQAVEEGAIALFGEKYGDRVRVLKIGRPYISAELCGGTHIAATGEIGAFYIINKSSIGSGLRRIEAVTGRGAEELMRQRFSELDSIARSLESSTEAVPEKVRGLIEALDQEHKMVQSLEKKLGRIIADNLLVKLEEVKGIRLVAREVPSAQIETLRDMSDYLKEQIKSGIIVLGSVYDDKPVFLASVTSDLVTRGYNAGRIVKKVAGIAGGDGGGKATMAQAGGKYKDKITEALKLVKSLL